MAELIVFPSAENVTIVAVRAAFTTLSETAGVHKTVPATRPDRFVTVSRSGGPRQTLVSDAAQITVESWGANDDDAHDLAQRARSGIHAMAGQVVDGVQVYFVNEFSGPANLPDPISNQSRFVQVFQISMRGTAA